MEEQSLDENREQLLERRRRLKARYGQLFDTVSEILFRHDPAEINFGSNTDEYDAEAGTIIPRLQTCDSLAAAKNVIHQELIRWFSLETIGSAENCEAIAQEIWAAWQYCKQI